MLPKFLFSPDNNVSHSLNVASEMNKEKATVFASFGVRENGSFKIVSELKPGEMVEFCEHLIKVIKMGNEIKKQ